MICLVHEWKIKYENGTNGANLALSSKPRHFDYLSRERTHGSLSATFLVGFDLLLHVFNLLLHVFDLLLHLAR